MRTTTNSHSLEGGLKALAEPTRLLILACLAKYGDLCVGQLVDALNIPQAGVSQHLRVLRYQGIVDVEREGQWAYYSLVPDRIETIVKKLSGLSRGDFSIPKNVAATIESSSVTHPRNNGGNGEGK